MKIAFYYVDEQYVEFLKEKELQSRGFTTVPNVAYSSRNKFLYGTVLEVSGINYFVPVSSYSKKQQDNFLIKIDDHHKEKIAGSLRFNYMIPVPEKCLIPLDFKAGIEGQERRIFIEKEYRFCKSKRSAIQKGAKKTYERVTNAASDELVKNSCDFKLLEKAYYEYLKSFNQF